MRIQQAVPGERGVQVEVDDPASGRVRCDRRLLTRGPVGRVEPDQVVHPVPARGGLLQQVRRQQFAQHTTGPRHRVGRPRGQRHQGVEGHGEHRDDQGSGDQLGQVGAPDGAGGGGDDAPQAPEGDDRGDRDRGEHLHRRLPQLCGLASGEHPLVGELAESPAQRCRGRLLT